MHIGRSAGSGQIVGRRRAFEALVFGRHRRSWHQRFGNAGAQHVGHGAIGALGHDQKRDGKNQSLHQSQARPLQTTLWTPSRGSAAKNIFIGSTNDASWNKDLTGARRFFPITCGNIDLVAVKRDRDQLWAEALVMYKEGVQWWLKDEETALAVQEQEARLEIDEWREPIERHVEDREQVTVGDILGDVFGLERAKWDQRSQNRVANCLKSMGWFRCQRRVDGRKTWVYVKTNR
jgi:hypothetical protein